MKFERQYQDYTVYRVPTTSTYRIVRENDNHFLGLIERVEKLPLVDDLVEPRPED